MYDNEIYDLIDKYNGDLPSKVYINICDTSPQLNHISYHDDYFEMWTYEGKYFKFKVHKGES